MRRNGASQPRGYEFSLVESSLPFTGTMQRDWDDNVACERFLFEAPSQNVAQRICQRNPAGVFEMVKDFTKCLGEKESRSRQVHCMVTFAADTAEAFTCWSGFAAERTERLFDRYQSGPTLRASGSPPALEDLRMAHDARDGEEQVEDGIDQFAFGKRKGDTSISAGQAIRAIGIVRGGITTSNTEDSESSSGRDTVAQVRSGGLNRG